MITTLTRLHQAAYASHFLYIVSLCLAKMALLHFLLSLALVETRRLAVNASMLFNLLSMVVGILAVAFQCSLPQPWKTLSDKCFNQVSRVGASAPTLANQYKTAFWISFGVMDILVDLATVILPFVLLHDLRTTWKRKLPAILAFSLRFL